MVLIPDAIGLVILRMVLICIMMRAGIVLFFYAGIAQESFDALVAFSEKC